MVRRLHCGCGRGLTPCGAVSEVETGFKTWFHFYIKGGKKGESITLRIRGLNAHSKLYGRDMRPVVRSVPSDKEWDRVKSSVEYKQDEEKQKIEIKLKHRFEYDDETTYIAFTYPYSYQHCQVCILCAYIASFVLASHHAPP